MTIQFKITNMSCKSCAMINEKSMRELKGINSAKVDFKSEIATVDYDEKIIGEKKIKQAVTKNGYGVI